MRKISYLVFVLALLLALFSCSREKEIITLTTKHLCVGVNSKGYVSNLKDLNRNIDYKAKEILSPLMALYTEHGDSIEYLPEKAIYEETSGILTIDYPNGSVVRIKIDKLINNAYSGFSRILTWKMNLPIN